MYKISKIVTEDGSEFEDTEKATKYLEVLYGKRLTILCHKIIPCIDKYVDLCEFIDNNLDLFHDLIILKNEINNGI